jgi:streptogramin lyase
MRRLLIACLALVALLLAGAGQARAQDACRPSLEERQRYGYVALGGDWAQEFDIDTLNAGWYANPAGHTAAPQGMDQTIVIRTPSGYTVDPVALGALVDANPGATWLIGSEPDCIWQDDVLPEEYARIYHDLYAFVKNRDAMAQVAAGGIVQPSPLRLQYLDMVLAEYQARYARPLPTDLWHIHNAILNEERGGWGADIPPGIDADQGLLRAIDDNDNMIYFTGQVRAFRQWMNSRGYEGYPLIMTEYGVLMPDDYGFDVTRVNDYMTDTFAYLSTATSTTLGAPWDGGRLVQRWTWFSLNVRPWDPNTGLGFNGNLFNPDTGAITAHGEHFAELTAGLAPALHVDLGLGRWHVPSPPELVSPTQTVDQVVEVWLVNAGTADSGVFQVRLAYDGPQSGTLTQPVASLPPQSARWVTFTLPGLVAGRYALTLDVDVGGQVAESAECNNQATRWLLVPGARTYLPLILSGPTAGGLVGTTLAAGAPARTPAGAMPAAAPPEPARPAVQDGSAPILVEYPLPQAGSYPGQLAIDRANGRLWVSERDGDRIARFDLATAIWQEEYDLPVGSEPWGLALDAAGNVWFAETGVDQIGKLDPASGGVTEYSGLAAGSEPWGVALDAVGNVWFTERAAAQIGKLDPASGIVTEYGLPPGSYPGGIAVYGDYVWFTETGTNLLGMFQISKEVFREFHTTPPYEEPLIVPEDVTVISGGNPWLTNTGGNGIALFRFSTLQSFYTLEAPTPNSEPYGIAVGGTKSIWFTERAGNKVGRYGPQAVVVEYALPTPGSEPTDVVVDGEGCAWYAAPGSDRIGRICPAYTYLPLVLR